ncbi:MAG: hypothetical protein IPL78_07580 [Chloroflexi bacterium]|nr:hypothetical protein [Chloroflexota bacterium]
MAKIQRIVQSLIVMGLLLGLGPNRQLPPCGKRRILLSHLRQPIPSI